VTLYLHGVGHFHPDIEITNRFLEELDIGTSESWIVERVGIHSRRTTLPLDYIRSTRNRDPRAASEAAVYDTAELGRRAAERALERAGIGPEDVGLVLAGGCASDLSTPAEACEIAGRLGVDAPALDVGSACTSFLAQLSLLSKMRAEALPEFVLLVVQEAMTRSVCYDDRSTAVLFGDAAAAAVVSSRAPAAARVVHADIASDPSAADKVRIPRLGHFVQEGRAVQLFAIRKSLEALARLESARGEDGRPLHLVGHQANLRVLQAVCERAGVGAERHHTNVAHYGNTGAASAPSVLSQAWDRFRPGDDVALVGVGAGLTWGGALVRFEAAA